MVIKGSSKKPLVMLCAAVLLAAGYIRHIRTTMKAAKPPLPAQGASAQGLIHSTDWTTGRYGFDRRRRGGNHGAPSHFQPADYMAFIRRCLAHLVATSGGR